MTFPDRFSRSGYFNYVSLQRRTLSLLSCTALTLLCACETISGPGANIDFDEPEKVLEDQPGSSSEVSENKGPPDDAKSGAASGSSASTDPSAASSASPAKSSKGKQGKGKSKKKKKVFPGIVPETVDAGDFPEIRSDLERESNPDTSYESMRQMLTANNDLGFDLLRSMAKTNPDNLAISPVSIHSAMGLLLGAATDETQEELIAGNGFLPDVDKTHAALSRISMQLAALEEEGDSERDPVFVRLANRIFVKKSSSPQTDYLDVLAKYYDTGAYRVDFGGNPEGAREAINQWVMDRTEDRIEDLLPEGSVGPLTQWAFVNALYYKAPWGEGVFDEKLTRSADFRLQDGKKVSVPMMRATHQHAQRGESKNYSWAAIALGHKGSTVAAFIKPKTGKVDEVLSKLSSAQVEENFENAERCELHIKMPRVKIKTGSEDLLSFYKDRGVKRVFGENGPAQLGGIGIGSKGKLTTLVHSVFFAMDEKGVEAAAATAGVVNEESDVEPDRCDPITLDEPFIFLIYDKRSELVLFAGRVMNPAL